MIAKVEGELLCRRLVQQPGLVALESVEAQPVRIVCGEDCPLEVWGVVTTVIRQMPL